MGAVQPAAVVRHEVVHGSPSGVPGVAEEGEAADEHAPCASPRRRGGSIPAPRSPAAQRHPCSTPTPGQARSHRRAGRSPRRPPGAKVREAAPAASRPAAGVPRRRAGPADRLAKHLGGLTADLRPRQPPPDRAGPGPHGRESLGIVEEVARPPPRGRQDRRTARGRPPPSRAGPPRRSTAWTRSGSPRPSRTSARRTRSARAIGRASGRPWSRRAWMRGPRGRGSGHRRARRRTRRDRGRGAAARAGTPRRGPWLSRDASGRPRCSGVPG